MGKGSRKGGEKGRFLVDAQDGGGIAPVAGGRARRALARIGRDGRDVVELAGSVYGWWPQQPQEPGAERRTTSCSGSRRWWAS
jgi:hypothetical protein